MVNDTFTHNTRFELTAALVNGKNYEYNYDNIGNRLTATEAGKATSYTANELNQYTSIQENEDATFSPLFDEDGNQTRIKTETGIWDVVYNAENRPVSFSNSESDTVIECAYDYMGRRCFKKVTVNGTVTLHQRYIYRGYLQIACCDLTRNNHPALWYITWDPNQPTSSRPLAIQKDGTWYTYGWDLTKNICEVYRDNGYISSTYTYAPYGEARIRGDVEQPLQWSSEFYDKELCMMYYNYRYYILTLGRWGERDLILTSNLYNFIYNKVSYNLDILGLVPKDSITKPLKPFITEANKKTPIIDEVKTNECIYFIFYDRDEKEKCIDHRWHKNEDNNYLSHVAVYILDYEKAIGFNPKENGKRIIMETRMDIALIKRCCKKGAKYSSVQSYLKTSTHETNAKFYFPIKEDGKYGIGRRWFVNGPNCSTFAWNVAALYFGNFNKPSWDFALYLLERAHRPEEFRKFLHEKNECQTIYPTENNGWQGTE